MHEHSPSIIGNTRFCIHQKIQIQIMELNQRSTLFKKRIYLKVNNVTVNNFSEKKELTLTRMWEQLLVYCS